MKAQATVDIPARGVVRLTYAVESTVDVRRVRPDYVHMSLEELNVALATSYQDWDPPLEAVGFDASATLRIG